MNCRSLGIACGLGALLGAFGGASLAADRVKETQETLASVCRAEGNNAQVCGCAAEEFRRATAVSDVSMYADVGRAYLARLKAAKPKMEAWDDAIGAVAIKKRILPADLADKTSALRVQYRDAIKQCAEATAAISTPEQKSP